ncbi:hypothetical protein BKA69DRAFT_1127704 [Paraphysoderma sedebokerense]|nr:hypothetical protein BKA69DRAFT_1127704 [Paraphysoderma sedebokerense]
MPNNVPPFEQRKQKFRQRVLSEVSLKPTAWSRRLQLLNVAVSLAGGAYFALYADFGPQEHALSPIRQWWNKQVHNMTTVTKEEVDEFNQVRPQ